MTKVLKLKSRGENISDKKRYVLLKFGFLKPVIFFNDNKYVSVQYDKTRVFIIKYFIAIILEVGG